MSTDLDVILMKHAVNVLGVENTQQIYQFIEKVEDEILVAQRSGRRITATSRSILVKPLVPEHLDASKESTPIYHEAVEATYLENQLAAILRELDIFVLEVNI